MEVVERRVEGIVAIAERSQSIVVAVYAGAQGAFEVGDSGAVDEVVEMFLRRAGWLEGSLDGCLAQYTKCRVETREGGVDIVQELLQPVSQSTWM